MIDESEELDSRSLGCGRWWQQRKWYTEDNEDGFVYEGNNDDDHDGNHEDDI